MWSFGTKQESLGKKILHSGEKLAKKLPLHSRQPKYLKYYPVVMQALFVISVFLAGYMVATVQYLLYGLN